MCDAAAAPPPRPAANEAAAAAAADAEEEYDDGHRRLLQLFMARKVLTQRELDAAVASLPPPPSARSRSRRAQAMVDRINARIGPAARLEIRRALCEAPAQETVYGLSDAACGGDGDAAAAAFAPDAAALGGSPYAPCDVAALRSALHAAVRAAADGAPRPAELSDALWARFEADGWLRFVGGGGDAAGRRATLGPRALTELRPYLDRTFGDELPRCLICEELALLGVRCPNERCAVRIHRTCLERLFARNPRRTCPMCSAPWHFH